MNRILIFFYCITLVLLSSSLGFAKEPMIVVDKELNSLQAGSLEKGKLSTPSQSSILSRSITNHSHQLVDAEQLRVNSSIQGACSVINALVANFCIENPQDISCQFN